MVKRGGTKRKIPIEKISKKETLATCHTKRTYGLFSKASQLCLLSHGSQIAVLATPSSSDSNVSFYSFGHSSVDSVVSAFLSGQTPKNVARKDLGFWWEDERLHASENPDELKQAMESISILMKQAKDLEANLKKKKSEQDTLKELDQTLNLKTLNQVDDVLPENFVNHHHDHQALVNDEDLKKNDVVEPVQTLINLHSVSDDDLNPANFNKASEEQDQILAICESFMLTEGNLDQEMDDICELIDFDTTTCEEAFDDDISSSSTLFSDTKAVEGSGDLVEVRNRAIDEDNLRFSDIYNDFCNSL